MSRWQRSPCRILTRALIIALLPFLASCQHALMSSARAADYALGPGLSLLATLNPFRSPDHVRFTSVHAAKMLAESKAQPAANTAMNKCLTLEDCRAMALANNLELQIARVDEFTKEAVKESRRARGLPHVTFSSELGQRDNPPYSYSDVLGQEGVSPSPESGTSVTNYSTSHERSTWRYVLETRWSPVDTALTYYLWKNSLNDRLKAHYQKVRVAQKLLGAVDAAYFRLLSLQDSLSSAKQLVSIRSQMAASMRRLHNKTIIRVEDYERTEQKAVEARRVLAKIQNEAERQKSILAAAMGLPPESCAHGGFSVQGKLSHPKFGAQPCDLELIAIKNRPEAYQAGLDHLNSVNDVKRAIVRYFPKVEGFWRYTRDKDKYLYNKDWKDIGLLVNVDLLDWISNGHESTAVKSMAERTYKELGAVALGITSQVRVAALTYSDTLDELQTREASVTGSQNVLDIAQVRVSSDDLSRLELEEAQGNLLYQRVQRIRALGEANAALAELESVLGTNYDETLPCN